MAFLQNAPPRQPIFRVPAVVLWLLVLLVAAHAARMLASPAMSDWIVNEYAFIPARYGAGGTLLQLAVPFVSYMALHGSLTHLAVNSLWLLAFGPVVARRFGAGLFILYFVICGIAAAATHLAFNWGSAMPVIGASGAISGLMAAGIRILPSLGARGAGLAPVFSRQVLAFTLLWCAVNLFAGLTGLGMGGEIQLVAWQAHLGGYFAGLLLAAPFDAWRPRISGEGLIP